MRKLYPFLVALIVAIGMIWYVKSGHASETNLAAAGNNLLPTSTPTSTPTDTPAATTSGNMATPMMTPASSSQTKTGQTVDTPYGPVQVQAVLVNGKLAKVKILQVPEGTGRDLEIANYAVPQLDQEAIQAQSANIDVVSGATFTSEGYIQSLQTALQS